MNHEKILNLLNELNDSNLCQENGILSMINQMQIMMQEIKLSTIEKFKNLIFVTTTMLKFY